MLNKCASSRAWFGVYSVSACFHCCCVQANDLFRLHMLYSNELNDPELLVVISGLHLITCRREGNMLIRRHSLLPLSHPIPRPQTVEHQDIGIITKQLCDFFWEFRTLPERYCGWPKVEIYTGFGEKHRLDWNKEILNIPQKSTRKFWNSNLTVTFDSEWRLTERPKSHLSTARSSITGDYLPSWSVKATSQGPTWTHLRGDPHPESLVSEGGYRPPLIRIMSLPVSRSGHRGLWVLKNTTL